MMGRTTDRNEQEITEKRGRTNIKTGKFEQNSLGKNRGGGDDF
jgi:hypothetical protein